MGADHDASYQSCTEEGLQRNIVRISLLESTYEYWIGCSATKRTYRSRKETYNVNPASHANAIDRFLECAGSTYLNDMVDASAVCLQAAHWEQ